MSAITQLTDATFDAATAQGTVLVDFWATWCGPCKMLAPVLEQAATELEGKVRFVKVNAEESPMLAKRFSVRSLPTMILLRDGAVVKQLGGAANKDAIIREIENV